MFSTASHQTASGRTVSRPRRVLRQITGIIVATAAMVIGFAVAGSAATAHADTYAGDAFFDQHRGMWRRPLFFTVNSDETDGSYAKIWVYDTATEEWVTDDIWVDADYYATFNVADLTFETGYYMVYVAYAQWNGVDYDYSGEYIETLRAVLQLRVSGDVRLLLPGQRSGTRQLTPAQLAPAQSPPAQSTLAQ